MNFLSLQSKGVGDDPPSLLISIRALLQEFVKTAENLLLGIASTNDLHVQNGGAASPAEPAKTFFFA